jgi:lipopolysaccharide/colanic/teichoic acid biosynthesis glycosyltransferase
MIRLLDFLFSLFGIIILCPFFFIIGLIIKIESVGPIFFIQERIGKDFKPFWLYKFRTMYNDTDNQRFITIGNRDPRITRVGLYLRRFKIDELPQLLNVIKGEMSIVGPRPEVRKYVDLYSEEQRSVLKVIPGITDYASIIFRNEHEMLAKVEDPDNYYIKVIMPKKLKLSIKYIQEKSIKLYFKLILMTVFKVMYDKEALKSLNNIFS